MRKRVGTKLYDTDKAVLVDTLDDGIQVYRKKNSPQFFLYNPNGKTGPEMFCELPPKQAEIYFDYSRIDGSKKVKGSTKQILFSEYDSARIKLFADRLGMSMSKFLLMLVDRYEAEQTDRG